jgi:hypothetical protein
MACAEEATKAQHEDSGFVAGVASSQSQRSPSNFAWPVPEIPKRVTDYSSNIHTEYRDNYAQWESEKVHFPLLLTLACLFPHIIRPNSSVHHQQIQSRQVPLRTVTQEPGSQKLDEQWKMPNDLVKWIQELKSLLAHPLLKWKQLLQISRGLLLRSHGMLLTIKMFTRSIEIISLAGIPIRFHSHPIITIPHPSPSPLSRPNSFALRLQIQSVWMSQRLGLGSQKLNEQ